MTTLTDVEVAELLMELDRKNLLEKGMETEIYNLAEKAVRRKSRMKMMYPDLPAYGDAVEDAERLREAEEMLEDNQISRERLREIADAMGSMVERMHVLNLGR